MATQRPHGMDQGIAPHRLTGDAMKRGRKRPAGMRSPVYMDTVEAFNTYVDWGNTPPNLRTWFLEFLSRSLPKIRNGYKDPASLQEWAAQIVTLTPEEIHPHMMQALMVGAWLVDAELKPGRVSVAKVKRMELRAINGDEAQRIIHANQTIRTRTNGSWRPVEGLA